MNYMNFTAKIQKNQASQRHSFQKRKKIFSDCGNARTLILVMHYDKIR